MRFSSSVRMRRRQFMCLPFGGCQNSLSAVSEFGEIWGQIASWCFYKGQLQVVNDKHAKANVADWRVLILIQQLFVVRQFRFGPVQFEVRVDLSPGETNGQNGRNFSPFTERIKRKSSRTLCSATEIQVDYLVIAFSLLFAIGRTRRLSHLLPVNSPSLSLWPKCTISVNKT